jgi:hypothetical protein
VLNNYVSLLARLILNLDTHTDILEALQAIDESSLKNPLTEEQNELAQEIQSLVKAVEDGRSVDPIEQFFLTPEQRREIESTQNKKSKWQMLSVDIHYLHSKEALRVINIMHKIGGINGTTSFLMKCIVYKNALNSIIARIAHTSISFAIKVLGPQIVSFLFLATKVVRKSLWYYCLFALFLNNPLLFALGAYLVGSIAYSVIDSVFDMFEIIADGIVKQYDQSVVENYAHIHGPKYVPQSIWQRISLLASNAITAMSSGFSADSLALTRGLARAGFILSAFLLPFFPGIALPLVSIMGASFVVDSVAKTLSIPHMAKATMTVSETDELCLAQINNSIAPNRQDLEAIDNSMALNSKIQFVNLCEMTINSLRAALDSKKYLATYQALHLFQGKLGHIPSIAPQNGVTLQDNPSLLAISSCLTGEGMLRKPQSTSIKDMPDLSENQQTVVRNLIANLAVMRDYVQENNGLEPNISAVNYRVSAATPSAVVANQARTLAPVTPYFYMDRKTVKSVYEKDLPRLSGPRARLTNG